MTCELIPTELSDEQKGQVSGILSVGCDLQTAADFIGCLLADVQRAMRHDPRFAAQVRRAEAGVELHHMRNVQETAKDKKEWRASVWWLERRSPERFGARGAGVVTARQLKLFTIALADMISTEIRDAADRQRLLQRFDRVVNELDETLRGLESGRAQPTLGEVESFPDNGDAVYADEASDADAQQYS